MKNLFLIFGLFFHATVQAKQAPLNPLQELKKMTYQYAHQGYVYSTVEKISTSAFFSKKAKKISGKIYFAKNHLKMIFDDEPQQIYLYKNGKSWVKSGKDPKVELKTSAKHPLLSLVLGQDKELEKYNIKLLSQKGKVIVLELKPKVKSSAEAFVKAIIDIDTSRPTIDRLRFWDDLKNKTEITFKKTRFKKKFKNKYFVL